MPDSQYPNQRTNLIPAPACDRRWSYGFSAWAFRLHHTAGRCPQLRQLRPQERRAGDDRRPFGLAMVYNFPFLIHGEILVKLVLARRKWIWPALGGMGFCIGLLLLLLAERDTIRHLGLIIMIAAPVIGLRQAMKAKLAPYCPRPGEPR
jgi:hypothetical protein